MKLIRTLALGAALVTTSGWAFGQGHSFRPTQDDNYKNAPGYSSNMGYRQQYKDMYRQAYQQGYQSGYNGR